MTDLSDRQIPGVYVREELIEAVDRLFIATDEKNWKTVRDCFTPTVHFDMSSAGAGPASDRASAEIASDWEKNLTPLAAIHHQAGNYRVSVDGERAKLFCYGIAYHYLPNPSGRNTRVFVGSYDFELTRASGHWKICAFRYNLKFVDGNQELGKPG
jgi:hypothetical protein